MLTPAAILDLETPGGPPWFMLVVLLVVIVGPIAAERLRVAGIIGLLAGGYLIGPQGLDLIESQAALEGLGEIGLLYLMFLAGLELDLKVFSANRNAAVGFGAWTFALPFALGLGGALLLDFSVAAAVLLGSLFASHTLLAYPQVREAGVAQDRAVAAAVGGTVITDTAALLMLAVIAGLETGNERGVTLLVELGVSLALLAGWCFVLLPRLGRWFFAGVGRERNLRFVFIFVGALSGAVVADVLGIEGIVGAFFAGLALNRLVPNRGPLMERVEFFGAAFLIPMFLISVGLLVDPGLMVDPGTLGTAAVFAGAVVVGKGLAARLAARGFGWSSAQTGTVFGLSVAQAAATLAAATTGFNIGLLGEETLNAILLVILVSILVATWAASRFAPRIAQPVEELSLGDTVLVPRGQADDAAPLISLAARVADADGGVVVPIHIAVGEDRETLATARGQVGLLDAEAAAAGVDAGSIMRVADSLEEGLASAIAEQGATLLLIERSRRGRISKMLLGPRREGIAAAPIPVAVVGGPAGRPKRVLLPLEPLDLGPEGPRGAGASATAFAVAAAGGETEVVVGYRDGPGAGSVERALLAISEEIHPVPTQGPRYGWASAESRPGDLVVLPGRPGRGAFGRDEEGLIAVEGVTVAVVVTPHGPGLATPGAELHSLPVVGRAEAPEPLV